MSQKNESDRLLSHEINQADLSAAIDSLKQKIEAEGNKASVTVAEKIDLIDQLSLFAFGRFLLMNGGINGYWTHYMLTHPWFGRKHEKHCDHQPLGGLERFILDKSPTMLATQQRFEIFLEENQKMVRNDAVLACVPCGMMGELLYLNYEGVSRIELVGIDFDPNALNDAMMLAEKQRLSHFVRMDCADAWGLGVNQVYDLISSNGLNIYEPDDDKVTALYQAFYKALKPNGKLVTSFLTPPPLVNDSGEWLMDQINLQDLAFQKVLFTDVLHVKWQCFRSSKKTQSQLQSVGFRDISFRYDQAHMFPTVIAMKD